MAKDYRVGDEVRRIVHRSGSHVVAIPPSVLEHLGLRGGDHLGFFVGRNSGGVEIAKVDLRRGFDDDRQNSSVG